MICNAVMVILSIIIDGIMEYTLNAFNARLYCHYFSKLIICKIQDSEAGGMNAKENQSAINALIFHTILEHSSKWCYISIFDNIPSSYPPYSSFLH